MGDPIATQAGHWYDKEGKPQYTYTNSKGGTSNTTLREAKKFGYVPSVTTVIKILAAPGLEKWKMNEMMEAAATEPWLETDTDATWIAKVTEQSKRKATEAAERGTLAHGQIEKFLLGEPYEDVEMVERVKEAMSSNSIDITKGHAEKSFAHPMGYGGKIDNFGDSWVLDFKTKAKIEDDKKLVYDEHYMQLAAYGQGVGVKGRFLNVFIGIEDKKVAVVEHKQEDIDRGWELFVLCLCIWKLKSGIK